MDATLVYVELGLIPRLDISLISRAHTRSYLDVKKYTHCEGALIDRVSKGNQVFADCQYRERNRWLCCNS
jgi:hypothetical protein